jgi:hypothetical protein
VYGFIFLITSIQKSPALFSINILIFRKKDIREGRGQETMKQLSKKMSSWSLEHFGLFPWLLESVMQLKSHSFGSRV